QSIQLAGVWRYAVEADYGRVEVPPAPLGPDNPNCPTALYNGMIHPLVPMAMRGAIWYQGESNVGRAKQYRTLFPTLINNWRHVWHRPDFAFHFVQLANYMSNPPVPSESTWAELREAQAVALHLPNTGMAVIIDIGESGDIHPQNKKDVGLRLAYNALHTTYGRRDVVPCGPLMREVRREGASLRVLFDHTDKGLVCKGDKLRSFAIAGKDRKFVWANAKIDGNDIIVTSPEVKEPVAVRYGWADCPECNLYNGAGLPASPFRSDMD
ncbi:MAG: 9-O-acetylesterase, partial [Phycisphaeraceae bacterium]|nr:9-O-acetylesterase [Phycisphaeraceae bacterium]